MSDVVRPPNDDTDTISVLDLIQVLAKRKWLVIGLTAAVAALSLGYAMLSAKLPPDSRWNLLPDIYRPEVRVLLLDRTSSSAFAAAQSGGLAGLGSIASLLGVPTPVNSSAALAEALLEGHTIHDQIAEEFAFVDRYQLEGRTARIGARQRVARSLQYEYNANANILTIAYEDIDAEFATAVLTRTVDILSQRFQEFTMETILRRKIFLEDRLQEVDEERRTAQDALLEFQSEYGIVDIVSQSEQTVALIAQYRRERLTQELEMQRLLEYIPANDAGVVRIRSNISLLDELIEQLELGGQRFGGGSIPQAQLPALAVEYLNLASELELHAGIYTLLRQQYESTRIEETDTSQTFQMVERAEVPVLKDRPSRSRIVVVTTLVGFFVAVLLAFLFEYIERAKADPQQAQKLADIRAQFRFGRTKPRA